MNQQMDKQLPEGWETSVLESFFAHVIGGDWGKDASLEDNDYEMAHCIRGTEFKNWQQQYGKTAVARKIKKSSLKNRMLMANDILIEISGGGPEQPVGRSVLITDKTLSLFATPTVCTNFIRLARPSTAVCAAYLNYYLTLFYLSGNVAKYQAGSNNLRNLKFNDYSQIEVPLPPLAEQHYLADKLDSLLARIQTVSEQLAAVPALLKQFRQSVLADAVSGKLTAGWREENPLTPQLTIEEYHIGVSGFKLKAKGLTQPITHNSWLKCQLGHVITVHSGTSLTAKEMIEGEVPVFGGNGITGYHNTSNTTEPTLVIGRVGFYCGSVHLTSERAWITDNALIVNFSEKLLRKDFAFYLLKATNLRLDTSSTAQPVISGTKIYPIHICLPPIAEQTEIVRRVEALFALADQIEQQSRAAAERVALLTQSVLAKAFRGELSAQWRCEHPDLISGDNSAAALLARIQAEREATGKKSRRA